MNSELFEKTAASRLTRRKIVTTGTKLAYAAPLVAASFKLTGGRVLAQVEDYCDECIPDALSPKQLEGGCYTCKTAASGCLPTQGSAQAADIDPQNIGGLVCICQSNECTVNGVTYQKGDNITALSGGTCRPVDARGTADDTCVGSVSPR
jgi:hypothetical protein